MDCLGPRMDPRRGSSFDAVSLPRARAVPRRAKTRGPAVSFCLLSLRGCSINGFRLVGPEGELQRWAGNVTLTYLQHA